MAAQDTPTLPAKLAHSTGIARTANDHQRQGRADQGRSADAVNNKDAIMPAWQLSFYNDKLAKLIEAWPTGIRASFLHIAETMRKHGPDLGLPHTRPMGAGLFEIRAKGREGIGRAFFCTVVDQRIVILHAFIKKTEQTPPRELEIARARMRETKT